MAITECLATELLERYRRGDTSPVEVVDAVLERIQALDATFNTFRFVDVHAARDAARLSEARWQRREPLGLLDGVPVALKDLLNVAGWPTRRGSLATSAAPVPEDSPAAARLREHGAILIGKTNTSEFGWKGLTESALAGITRNPWNPNHTPTGSSGGAAAAAALGLCPLHVATDGGGSIRIPAAACGVFGFKPSFGRVPCYPLAHTGTVFHVGTITRSVQDAALLLDVISGYDPRDVYALPQDNHLAYRRDLSVDLAGLRIAYSATLGYASVDPEIAALIERAVEQIAKTGVVIERVDPGFANPAPIHRVLWEVGAAKLLRGIPADLHGQIEPGLRELAERGRAISLAQYQDAIDAREQLGIALRRFHQRYDLLLTPTLAAPVPLIGTPPNAPFGSPFNLTQQPACSVTCGVTANGLPTGLQLVAAPHADALLLQAAAEITRILAFPQRVLG